MRGGPSAILPSPLPQVRGILRHPPSPPKRGRGQGEGASIDGKLTILLYHISHKAFTTLLARPAPVLIRTLYIYSPPSMEHYIRAAYKDAWYMILTNVVYP